MSVTFYKWMTLMSILIIFLLLFVRTLLKDCIITPSRQALGRRGLRLDFEFGEGHALNAFNTTDKGLVYVDCTRGFSTPIIAESLMSVSHRSKNPHCNQAILRLVTSWPKLSPVFCRSIFGARRNVGMSIAEFTDSAKREEREHDKIAYVVEGKEYGLISIDKGNIARILVLWRVYKEVGSAWEGYCCIQ